MTRYRTILFDLDGTLVDSYEALTEAINTMLRAHGRSLIEGDAIKELVGEGVERLIEKTFAGNVPDGAQAMFEGRYDEVCCERSRLLDGVMETLDALHALGVAMAVCTNKPTSFSRKILEHLGVARHFRAIVGPDLAGARKPDAQHVRHTMQAAGGARDETIFVGDMPIDVSAARNSGIDVAVIATGSSDAADLRAATPDFLLARFSDLIHVVREGALE
ncbi:MAG TPA: HAD-IA family hydrolase [Thermoanaerobaculia bacterium]